MPFSAKTMLGPRLINNDGADVPSSSLDGKVVALYFSASWCGPCRGFTPQLIRTYNDIKAAGKAFEVVLIGSDRSKADFEKYHKEMPWLALPFDDRGRKNSISTKFRVRGIPSLVILDQAGAVITLDGREEVGDDPEGKKFPWKPKDLSELLGTEFLTKRGLRGVETIQGKTLALYFSAHWCPPCRAFTPRLVQTYKAIKERTGGDDVQFVFVSSDKDEASFNEYYGEMPWTAIPFHDVGRRRALAQRLGVRGIPALATISADGIIINQTAKGAATADSKGLDFPWWPKPVEDLSVSNQSNGFHLQEMASLIVLMEGADDLEQKEVEEALLPIAEAEAKSGKDAGEPSLIFFTAKSQASVPTQVRNVVGMKTISEAPQMVILNIPGNGAYYVPTAGTNTPVNAASITAFISAYKAGTLTRSQITRG